MIPIKGLLNKIKWDKREAPEQYSIFYFDRILKKLINIPYAKIKRLEGSFMVLDIENLPKVFGVENRKIFNNEEESNVPLHRVKKVMKNNTVVWERN